MARWRKNIRRRSRLPEGKFHVMNRGAKKLVIFAGDGDRDLFVRLMVRFATKWKVLIISWCLMPNHFHLEIQATGAAMGNFMRDLQATYALAFNRRHRTSGCVFQGRFRCIAIQTGVGLAYVSRYIHANPRDLGVRPQDYGWSSCRSFLSIAPMPPWLHPEAVFEAIRKPGIPDSQSYREYLAAVPAKLPSVTPEPDEFSDWDVERVRRLEELLAERKESMGGLLGKTSLRSLVCWAARAAQQIPAQAVARYYGYSSVDSVHSIVTRFQERISGSPQLREQVEGDLF